nr:hypothetical protein [Crucivirus sp.]
MLKSVINGLYGWTVTHLKRQNYLWYEVYLSPERHINEESMTTEWKCRAGVSMHGGDTRASFPFRLTSPPHLGPPKHRFGRYIGIARDCSFFIKKYSHGGSLDCRMPSS